MFEQMAHAWLVLKVLFMLGYSDNARRVARRIHILSKPFSKTDLANRVREVTDDA